MAGLLGEDDDEGEEEEDVQMNNTPSVLPSISYLEQHQKLQMAMGLAKGVLSTHLRGTIGKVIVEIRIMLDMTLI